MNLLAFILLISIAGSHCFSPECYEKFEKTCGDTDIDLKIPENGEELDGICSQLISRGNCRIEVQETCEDEKDINELRVFRKVMDYVVSVCNPDNEIYKVVLDNLKCMVLSSENVRNACFHFRISEARKEVVTSYLERLNAQNNTDSPPEACSRGIWRSACTAITVGEMCGQESRDAILDMFTNVEYSIVMYCSDAETALIPEFVQDYEQAEKEFQMQEDNNK